MFSMFFEFFCIVRVRDEREFERLFSETKRN